MPADSEKRSFGRCGDDVLRMEKVRMKKVVELKPQLKLMGG